MEYCGLRKGHQVRAATKAGRSRSGKKTKPRSTHSRRSCYRTADKGLSNKACMMGESGRCVIHGKNPASLERSRSRSRSKYVPHPRVKKVRETPVHKTTPPKLTKGPYRFEFMVDTDLDSEAKVIVFYNKLIEQYRDTNRFELLDSFEVDHVDDNLYEGIISLNRPPMVLEELLELIDNIISPGWKSTRIAARGDLLEETITLNGIPVIQNGGRYYYRR